MPIFKMNALLPMGGQWAVRPRWGRTANCPPLLETKHLPKLEIAAHFALAFLRKVKSVLAYDGNLAPEAMEDAYFDVLVPMERLLGK